MSWTGAGGAALVTGGAGFVGSNLVDALLGDGTPVRVLDDLSRPGVERNLAWLRQRHGDGFELLRADLVDPAVAPRALDGVGQVFHLAAQVAVTSSLHDPMRDFDVNVRGTLHLLEALRAMDDPPALVYTSSNKVYGDLADVSLEEVHGRYRPRDPELRQRGVHERVPLAFRTPYGCSKGAADQYVLDYAGSYGLPTVVLRMSCIYGPLQHGTEDQGWVAHFVLRSLEGRAITLFGDGKQVRDLLYVDDLVRALRLVARDAGPLAGRAFNIGGGTGRTASLLEVIDLLEELQGERPRVRFEPWRPGDQRYYVSDVTALSEAIDWRPQVEVADGVARLHAWLRDARPMEAR